MNSVLALFSPRKSPPPPLPPFPEAPSPKAQSSPKTHPSPKSKLISKKDKMRAQRALDRLTSSDTNYERGQTSSPAAANDPIDEADRNSQLEDEPDENDMIDLDATPAIATELPLQSPQARRRPARNSEAHDVEQNNEAEKEDIEGEEGEEEEEEDDKQYTFKGIVGHRWKRDEIEVEVQWEQGPATWEPEENFHRDAPDSLFAYWKAQGGRPLNPKDPDLFVIFAIRKHSPNKKRLLVEWLGYGAEENSWLPREAVEETAPAAVEEYLKSLPKGRKRK
ncbi:hypothetical protein QQZ08_010666 [Neonectria magnoliae]|uniref:Chromo domain-containing protein n=1 Tax=Neonectria magnoliae TaxID=2732573 RepID=A0ABR1HF54_9HYPO